VTPDGRDQPGGAIGDANPETRPSLVHALAPLRLHLVMLRLPSGPRPPPDPGAVVSAA